MSVRSCFARALLLPAATVLLAACGSDADPVASHRGALVMLRGDVALFCDAARLASDHPHALPDCDAAVADATGTWRALGRGGLLGAQRLDATRLLLHTRDLRVVLRDAHGSERSLATAVADPRVAEDGRRAVWTELPAGTTELHPGTPGRLVLVDLERGTRRVVTEDREASAPFIVPGSDDVLYVSARTGVASLWLASPGRAPRQLTNVGARRVDPSTFVPVPGRELTFLPGARAAVFTASYDGSHQLWRVDLDSGAARPLGAGRFPAAVGGRLVALRDGALVEVQP